MARKLMPIEQSLTLLAATPVRIAEVTHGLAPEDLRRRPVGGGWSANEVLAHLRACADARGECIPRIVAADHPTLRSVNPLTWIKQTDYLEQEFGTSLRAFARQRAKLLALMTSLRPEAWSRTASFTGAGAPIERSVHFYADWVAGHERPHVKQIAAIAADLR